MRFTALMVIAPAILLASGCYVDFAYPDASSDGGRTDSSDASECSGCMSGDVCVESSVSACGIGGAICRACDDRECVDGACVVDNPVLKISLGSVHSCAVFATGTACWGSNDMGRLGQPRSPPESRNGDAVLVGVGVNAMSLSAGHAHSCLVDSEGFLHCWGNETTNEVQPSAPSGAVRQTPVLAFDEGGFTQVATGSFYTCALQEGELSCWGRSSEGQLGHDEGRSPSPVDLPSALAWAGVSATASKDQEGHTCAWTTPETGGALYCFGRNTSGQLGLGNRSNQEVPTPVVDDSPSGGFLSVSTGESHTCGIRADHSLWCWGANDSGQLGIEGEGQALPVRVEQEAGTRWTHVATGDDFTCAIDRGRLFCFGDNEEASLGIGTIGGGGPTLREVTHPTGISWSIVDAGWGHTCASDIDGELFCWGRRTNAQTGGSPNTQPQQEKTVVAPP